MVIVDTSAAYKWFNQEEINSDQALDLLNSHLSEANQICVPDLILYELANAWSTKGELNAEQIKDNLRIFVGYNLIIVNINLDLIEKAVELSKNIKVTVYDAIFSVLAQEKQCDLITADEKFVKAVNLPYVKLLSNILLNEDIAEGLKDIKERKVVSWKEVKKKAGI